jgi:two-component system, chemotaxis family, response regulator Rcp1
MEDQRPPQFHRHREVTRRLKILLVEDNEADVWLFKEALNALGSPHDLEVARDGEEAIARLKQADKPPDLILLDINMPKVDGFEVLSFVRSDARLCIIPVIILSSSRDDRDVRRAHELGANSYLCKTVDDFSDLVGDFNRYWLNRAEIPQVLA